MRTKIYYFLILLLLFISTQLIAQVKIGSTVDFYISPNTSVAFLGNVELQDASKLVIANSGKAYFSQPITVNSGNINLEGDVEFISPGNQTLSNFDMTVNNLKIGTKLTIYPNKYLTVNGVLTNDANNAGLIIRSNVAGTGSLLHSTTNVPATVERYIAHTNTDEFHMLSSPVIAQAISPDFNEIDGFYAWDEPTSTWIEYAEANFTTVNGGNNFIPGKGYAISYPSVITKSFIGNLNEGTINIPLTVTPGTWSGWNYVANPYPSAINWNAISGWTRDMLEDAGSGERAMWVWNASTGNYGAYISNAIGVGTNGVSRNVAVSQGFWVKAAIPGVFSMNNDVREHSSQAFLKSTGTDPEMIRMTVTGTANTYSDEIIINYGKLNDQGGAEKRFSMDITAPSLYSTKFNKNWSINYLTTIAEYPVVPVGFKAGVDAIYTINLEGTEWFNYVILEDLKTGIQKNMSTNSTYQFTAQTGDSPNRFLLHFSPLGINETSKITPKIYYNNQSINIFNPWTGKTTAQVYDVNGSLIKTFDVKHGIEDYNFNPSRGIYIVRMINENQVYKTKIVTF